MNPRSGGESVFVARKRDWEVVTVWLFPHLVRASGFYRDDSFALRANICTFPHKQRPHSYKVVFTDLAL